VIEVEFSHAAVDYSSVVDGTTFKVLISGDPLSGKIIARPNNTVWWMRSDAQQLEPLHYQVQLIGGTTDLHLPAIQSQQDSRLDGEPTQLSSGDGTEGGNFVFEMYIKLPH
jgi:hypothetical protein